jgi:hypothetical protein
VSERFVLAKTKAPKLQCNSLGQRLATELFGLRQWCLDERMPLSPERMDQTYHQLVNPALNTAFTVPPQP